MNQQNQAQFFTALQIARALGRRRQAIQLALEGVKPSGTALVRGNVANAWSIAALPAKLRNELAFIAAKRGYRNTEALLSAPPTPWEPRIPLSKVDSKVVEKAIKLRAALRTTLVERNAEAITSAELERLGVADYAAEFGYSITERHWRTLYKRTIERDGGAENWDRLEIYLDETARERPEVESLAPRLAFPELDALTSRVSVSVRDNPALARLVWVHAFEAFREREGAGENPKQVKRRLLTYLEAKAPFLASGAEALRKAFERKYAQWLSEGCDPKAIADRRVNSGHRRGPCETEKEWAEVTDLVIAHAVTQTGGRLGQAWREMMTRSLLPPYVLNYYIANPANKSYVPKRIRSAVMRDTRILNAIHRSPTNVRANGAHLILDWTTTFANQAHCSDDTTPPVYFYVPDGNGWYSLMRGQLLITIDCRSLRVLGFVLIPERNYNAFAIHTLYTRVWSECGVPEMLLHENGIWNKSRLLKGQQNGDGEPLDGDEIELGLREFGVKFRHAREARAKPVERVMDLLQRKMEREPGYCGRNEIKDRYDQLQEVKKGVEARRVDPKGVFYSLDQWEARLATIIEEYNGEPQNGDVLKGLSPDEAYERFQNPQNPPMKFDGGMRYLLAHKRPVKIGRNGITLRIGTKRFNYHNSETGKRIGENVLAWFNPDAPEILTITDMNRRNPVCIEQSREVPALDAPAELLSQELAKVAEHQGYGKARYRVLKAKFKQLFRRTVADAQTVEVGREIERQKDEIQKNKAQAKRNARTAAELGVTIPKDRAGTETLALNLNRFKSALEAAEAEAEKEHI